jgi:hypothetical protein
VSTYFRTLHFIKRLGEIDADIFASISPKYFKKIKKSKPNQISAITINQRNPAERQFKIAEGDPSATGFYAAS